MSCLAQTSFRYVHALSSIVPEECIEAILGAQRESHAVDDAHEAAADMAAASSLSISTLSENGLDAGHAELDFLFALRVGHGTLLTFCKRLFCEQHVAFADAGVPQ